VHSQELSNLDARPQFPTIKCGKCKMIWLVPGLTEGDKYECKRCGSIILTPVESEMPPSLHKRAES